MLFDSAGEAKRYAELCVMQRGGLISGLERQPKFVLQKAFVDAAGAKVRPLTYTADFRYFEAGQEIIEDFKGWPDEKFKIKWKIVRYQNPGLVFRISK
jgi:hypothetical protein